VSGLISIPASPRLESSRFLVTDEQDDVPGTAFAVSSELLLSTMHVVTVIEDHKHFIS
jgi:hypothetical protein